MYLPQGTELHHRYVIESLLGHGGFGITYSALDKVLNVKVAIKEYLPRQLATRAEGQTKVTVFTGESRKHYDYGLRKFLEEAQSVARFAPHPDMVESCQVGARHPCFFVKLRDELSGPSGAGRFSDV